MRTKKHYENLLDKNPNASVGFTLAAQAVYASRNGVFDNNSDDFNDEEYRKIALGLKKKYGDNLAPDEVRREMKKSKPGVELIIRNVPLECRQELKSKSALEGKSMNAVVLELIKKYLEK